MNAKTPRRQDQKEEEMRDLVSTSPGSSASLVSSTSPTSSPSSPTLASWRLGVQQSPSSGHERLWKLQQKLAPYLFVSPFVILFCCFMLYPLCRSVVLSFYKAAGPRQMKFVGLDNFRFILSDRIFWAAVANTTYYTVLFLSLQLPLSLILAILLNNPRLKFRNFFRFAFFSSHLVGGVFVAVIFGMLLAQRHGLINQAIGAAFPFIGTEVNWFGKPELAMPAVVIAALWISIGYGMIYFL